MDSITKTKIKGLLLQNFSNEEVASILKVNEADISLVANELGEMPIHENSTEYYKELQKELSKLVLTEINKPNRDSSVVLNAIRLQAEIQEKKLILNKVMKNTTKVSKDYIYERDEKIYELWKKGHSKEEIADLFQLKNLSIESAIDRCGLNLPDELKTISPTIVAETACKGLDREARLKILWDVYNQNLSRKQVREILNQMKNEMRKAT